MTVGTTRHSRQTETAFFVCKFYSVYGEIKSSVLYDELMRQLSLTEFDKSEKLEFRGYTEVKVLYFLIFCELILFIQYANKTVVTKWYEEIGRAVACWLAR